MPVFRDAVSDTTTTTGTGTITLAGVVAVAGTRTISSAHSNADTLYYRIENSDNTEWEVGLGTYTSSGTTLSRDTILASSNSGSAVNFSAGTKNVYTVIPASFRARGTITTSDPFEYTQTWNAGGVTFTALRVNVTNTASATASMLADFQVGGFTIFNVTRNAVMTLTGPSSTPARIVSASAFRAAGLSVGFNFASGTGVAIEDSAGSSYVGGNASGFVVLSTGYYGFTSSTLAATVDTMLYRDAANTLAQRNSTNAQTFRIYNTYTDASNYERGFVRWSTNDFQIGTEAAGTGSNRPVKILAYGNAAVDIAQFSTVLRAGSTASAAVASTGMQVASTLQFSFSSNSTPTTSPDAGFKRSAANIIGVTNGSTGAGSLEFQEMTAPSAPSTNNVRIYAEDNGSGKTRLMALFPTGAAQQIAIEP